MSAVCGTERPSPEPEATIRFAALGDSVTVGLGDRMPQGGWRGWAAILASSLAPADQVELTNLARCGALIKDVANEQLPQALALRPTFASVLVGVNDTLRGKFDPAVIAADLESIVCALQRAGTLVLTASLPDPGLLLRIPASLRRPLARRAQEINAVFDHLAVRYDIVHIDVAACPEIYTNACGGSTASTPANVGIGYWHGCFPLAWHSAESDRSSCPVLSPPTPSPAPGHRPGGWPRRALAGWSGDPTTWCPGCCSSRRPTGGITCAAGTPSPACPRFRPCPPSRRCHLRPSSQHKS
ncbi:MAG TPA: SGNH/GDSL hydrolase family protein [Streptosporangiaceae bacterium]|nr:SGNH/GDSL hydrolase family protein [Streptosporangiaceae bacterium]